MVRLAPGLVPSIACLLNRETALLPFGDRKEHIG
jgi:hypothetical protein